MRKVLIILGNYSPNPSSVANCMKPLIKRMSKVYNVDIITDRKNFDIPEHELHEKVNIYRVEDFRIMNSFYLNELKKINSSWILKKITNACVLLLKALYYFRYSLFTHEKPTGGWNVQKIFNKYCELKMDKDYDLVISVSMPFRSHYVAEKIKYNEDKNIKWIVFEFDPLLYNDFIKVNPILRKKMYIDEKRIFEKCDCIVLTPELYNFYKKENYINSSKVNMLPFANLERVEYDFSNINGNFLIENKINCLFTGTLYDDIRNPSTLFNIFSKLNKDISLSIMSNLSMEEIKKYAPDKYLPNVIPFQNRDTAIYNLMNADILVNIGNTVEFQVPGKIFEYMSIGKPIIHFSKIKNDPALEYLNRYPMVFIVNEWEVEKKDFKDNLEKFCKNNKNKQLIFEEVNENLGDYSGEAVVDKFITILNEMLGD